MNKWDSRFFELAKVVASWSKDPSTKVGAVIVKNKRIISVGYNGFAQGVNDTMDRYTDRPKKYPRVIHAEKNAILFADRLQMVGSTLYSTTEPCAQCAAYIIQAQIKKVVAFTASPDIWLRCKDDFLIARNDLEEAGLELVYY